jgi:hypothetical protein
MDTRVLRRGSASHSRDKVNRNILTIKSAAFLKKIGNGPGQFAYKLIDSLCLPQIPFSFGDPGCRANQGERSKGRLA